MKTASLWLTIVSMAVNTLIYVFDQNIVMLVLLIASIVSGIITIISIASNKKIVGIGLLNIIFNEAIAGVFYLLWKQEEKPMKIKDSTFKDI